MGQGQKGPNLILKRLDSHSNKETRKVCIPSIILFLKNKNNFLKEDFPFS